VISYTWVITNDSCANSFQLIQATCGNVMSHALNGVTSKAQVDQASRVAMPLQIDFEASSGAAKSDAG
jgi:hypothetical protein